MRLWSFDLRIIRRDPVLEEIDELLRSADPSLSGVEGLDQLINLFRQVRVNYGGALRRIDELERMIKEYEKAAATVPRVEVPPDVDGEPTPIELEARRSSGVDLGITAANPGYARGGIVRGAPVYNPGPDYTASGQALDPPAVGAPVYDPDGTIAPDELEGDERA